MEKLLKKDGYSSSIPSETEYQKSSGIIGSSEFETSKDYVIKKHLNLFKKLAKLTL